MNLKFPYLMSISRPNVSSISQAPNNKRPKVVPATNSKKDLLPKKKVVSSPSQVPAVVSKSGVSANASKALLPKKEVVSSPVQVSAVVSKSAISTNASEASKNKEVQETSPLLPKSLAKKKITKGTSQISGTTKTEISYTIYLKSYPDKELALSAAKRLTRLGYEVYIARVNMPGMRAQYRVLLGSFKDKKTPWKVIEGLKDKGDLKEFPNAVIERASDAMGKPL
ncbi:MAG: hypothetical protein GWP10_04915 [Nitrospiraceae bacterium]|nr:hypothetical protein [Nitrospiraceae bacterium]